MAEVQSLTITAFEGMVRGRRTGQARSLRRQLDVPYDLQNFLIDENGHLLMPTANTSTLHDFGGGTGRVRRISNITHPDTALIVQVDGVVYTLDTTGAGPYTPQQQIAATGNNDPVWVNTFQDLDYTLVGNENKTWKIDTLSGAATEMTSSTQQGVASYVYKGRRFVCERGSELIYYSDLNDPITFGVDSSFGIGGDARGSDWSMDPGSPVGFAEWGDSLVILCTQSIFLLNGTSPETFVLRRTNSKQGAWTRETIVNTEMGIVFFGGTPRNEFGIYTFTGNDSELISAPVSAFFRRWEQDQDQSTLNLFEYAHRFFHCFRWQDNLIFSAEGMRDVEGDVHEVFVYDLIRRTWTTFGGWDLGPRMGAVREYQTADRLVITESDELIVTEEPFARPVAEGASAILGWHDDEDPMGLKRFIAVKVLAWKGVDSTGTPTITITASTPNADPAHAGANPVQVVVGPRDIDHTDPYTPDYTQPLVFPINLRGNSIRLLIEVEPDNDDDEVLIESVQLVYSAKGPKLSRH